MKITYKGLSLDLRSGDIVAYRNNFRWNEPMTWLSAAVRFFTRCRYNHSALIVFDEEGELVINEAVAKGIISRPLQAHLERTYSEILVIRPREQNFPYLPPRFARSFALARVGGRYDFWSLLFFQLVYRVSGWWWGPTNERAQDAMVCSEYIAYCYGMPKWWLLSTRELVDDPNFVEVYREI